MDGIHLLGEWYGCPADTPEFTRAAPLREQLVVDCEHLRAAADGPF